MLKRGIGMGLKLSPLSLIEGGYGSQHLVTVGDRNVDNGFACVVVGEIFVHIGVAGVRGWREFSR